MPSILNRDVWDKMLNGPMPSSVTTLPLLCTSEVPVQGNLFPTTWATPRTDWTWDSRSHWMLGSKRSQHHRKGPFMALCENVLRCKGVQSHFGHEEGAVLAGMAWNRINKNEQGGSKERGKSSLCGWGPAGWDKRSSGRRTGGMKEGSWARPFLPITLIHCPPLLLLLLRSVPFSHARTYKVFFELGPLSLTSALWGLGVQDCLSCLETSASAKRCKIRKFSNKSIVCFWGVKFCLVMTFKLSFWQLKERLWSCDH